MDPLPAPSAPPLPPSHRQALPLLQAAHTVLPQLHHPPFHPLQPPLPPSLRLPVLSTLKAAQCQPPSLRSQARLSRKVTMWSLLNGRSSPSWQPPRSPLPQLVSQRSVMFTTMKTSTVMERVTLTQGHKFLIQQKGESTNGAGESCLPIVDDWMEDEKRGGFYIVDLERHATYKSDTSTDIFLLFHPLPSLQHTLYIFPYIFPRRCKKDFASSIRILGWIDKIHHHLLRDKLSVVWSTFYLTIGYIGASRMDTMRRGSFRCRLTDARK